MEAQLEEEAVVGRLVELDVELIALEGLDEPPEDEVAILRAAEMAVWGKLRRRRARF